MRSRSAHSLVALARRETYDRSMKIEPSSSSDQNQAFTNALRKVVTTDAASSRAATQASKATKPSLHKRFVYDPAKDRA